MAVLVKIFDYNGFISLVFLLYFGGSTFPRYRYDIMVK